MIAKVRRVVPLTVVAVTKLAGSASLQFVRHTAVGVYIRRSRYAEVINRRVNTPIALKELRQQLHLSHANSIHSTQSPITVLVLGECKYCTIKNSANSAPYLLCGVVIAAVPPPV